VIEIEFKVAAVMFTVITEEATPVLLAVIVTLVPARRPVTKPVLVTVARAGFELVQVTLLVKSTVLPSV
jgi:hypothetical protein